jgi:hypothetical protein
MFGSGLLLPLLAVSLLPSTLLRVSADQAPNPPLTEACATALSTTGTRWDGIPMEPYVWTGDAEQVASVAGRPVAMCRAGGPPEALPATNSIGCLLVDARLALIDGKLACGAYASVQPAGDILLWIARNNAATTEVTPLRWTGSGFESQPPYVARWDDPIVPAQSSPRPECRAAGS